MKALDSNTSISLTQLNTMHHHHHRFSFSYCLVDCILLFLWWRWQWRRSYYHPDESNHYMWICPPGNKNKSGNYTHLPKKNLYYIHTLIYMQCHKYTFSFRLIPTKKTQNTYRNLHVITIQYTVLMIVFPSIIFINGEKWFHLVLLCLFSPIITSL